MKEYLAARAEALAATRPDAPKPGDLARVLDAIVEELEEDDDDNDDEEVEEARRGGAAYYASGDEAESTEEDSQESFAPSESSVQSDAVCTHTDLACRAQRQGLRILSEGGCRGRLRLHRLNAVGTLPNDDA